MKSLGLRRSLNNSSSSSSNPSQPSPPLPGPGGHANPLSRPADKVAPPQKVIKALRTHTSTNPQELSYQEGDFWYVTAEREGWFEALNPLTGSRGLVPKDDFEEFGKGGRKASDPQNQRTKSQDGIARGKPPQTLSPISNPRSPPIQSPPSSDNRKNKQPVYAIVQYDFQAERPDELDAKKGEPIIVIAQSNHEWFVAKPIGRLGGPGLIPVAFVDIRDPTTGRPIEVLPDTIPMVEEWKKATADYKAAAIPLGRFDFPGEPAGGGVGPGAPDPSYGSIMQQSSSSGTSERSVPRSTSTSSLTKANTNGNRRISAAASGSASTSAPPPTPLYRPEEDAMLPPGELTALSVPSFHNESGNYWFVLHVNYQPDDRRAPGYFLALYRTYEDFYDFQITLLDTFPHAAGRPSPGNEGQPPPERILPYMPGPVDDPIDEELTDYRRDELDAYVRALVELRGQGAGYILRHELFRSFFAAKYGDHCQDTERQEVEVLDKRMGDMRISQGSKKGSGPGSGPDPRAASAMSRHSERSGGGGGGLAPSPHRQQQSLPPTRSTSRNASRGPSPLPPVLDASTSSAGHRSSSSQAYLPTPITTTSQGSGAQVQPPFIKIKIYDRATDDLIAIRVHPNVSHADLFEKVRARLGSEVQYLRYKDNGNGMQGGYREIRDDRELRAWMAMEDTKLVLYADQ